MTCPTCDYIMSAFDIECPRCAHFATKGISPTKAAPVLVPVPEIVKVQVRFDPFVEHSFVLNELADQYRKAKRASSSSVALTMIVPFAGFYAGTQAANEIKHIRLEVARLGVGWSQFEIFAQGKVSDSEWTVAAKRFVIAILITAAIMIVLCIMN